MVSVRNDDICNLPYIQHVTGINSKTLWAWINRNRLPTLDAPRVRRGHVFSWSESRPKLAELAKGMPDVDPDDWPD